MSVHYAAIDLGGTNFTVAIGDGTGRVLIERKFLTESHSDPAAVLARLASAVAEFCDEISVSPMALGMGAPGLVDVPRGTTRFLPNLPTQWRDVPVREILEQLLGCQIYVMNDARAATLGEREFGLGRDVQTMLFFTLGTGVGGGLVVNGRLHLGPLGAAGEFGHVQVDPEGPWCGCGSRGCLETVASGPALIAEGVRLVASGNAPRLRELVAGDVSRITPTLLGEAARNGEKSALRMIERAGAHLGAVAAGLVSALHPDLIVLGGGVSGLADLLIPPMREVIAARVRMFPTAALRIERSALGDRAGVLGALALALRGADFTTTSFP